MLTGGDRTTRRESPIRVPLCPTEIPHRLTWARTQASAARNRRLTAARPMQSVKGNVLSLEVQAARAWSWYRLRSGVSRFSSRAHSQYVAQLHSARDVTEFREFP
jgi:hypothetical protein